MHLSCALQAAFDLKFKYPQDKQGIYQGFEMAQFPLGVLDIVKPNGQRICA